MKIKLYQIYNIASLKSESLEAYTSLALAVVSVSWCFKLSLSRKLQKHIYREEWNML